MKGIFDAYLLWPFDHKLIFELRNFTVLKNTMNLLKTKKDQQKNEHAIPFLHS